MAFTEWEGRKAVEVVVYRGGDAEKTTGAEGRSREISWDSMAVIQAKTEMAWFRWSLWKG